MMLGKRGRPTMKRTTSMKGFEFDNELPPSPSQRNHHQISRGPLDGFNGQDQFNGSYGLMLSPRNFSSSHVDVSSPHHVDVADPDFLRTCGLCNRLLVSGRDIYMYRGDTAFCSLECREEKIKQDDKKERRQASKNGEASYRSTAETTGSSGHGNCVAAASQN